MDRNRLDAMLTALMVSSQTIIFIKDREGCYLTASEGMAVETGFKREQLIGATDFDLFPEDVAEKLRLDDLRIMASDNTETYEEELFLQNKVSYRLTTKGPLVIDGNVEGLFVISRDISQVKSAEHALAESEQRYREVFNQQFQFMAILSLDGHVLEINDLPLKTLSVTRDDFIGKLFWDTPVWRNTPEWQAIWLERAEQAKKSEEAILTEDTFQNKSGETRYADSAIQAIRDKQGVVTGFLVQAKDTTDKKLAELRIHYEHALQEKYLNTMQAVMVALDEKGCIRIINPFACKLLGYQESELLGKNWFATCLPQPEAMEEVFPFFQSIMRGDSTGVEYYENEVLCHDGNKRLIAWHNTVLEDESGKIIGSLSSGQDLTEQKQMESKLLYRLNLEGALSEVSANLTQSHSDNIDLTIENALQTLGLTVKADRSYLFQMDVSGNTFSNTHEWCNEGVAPQKPEFQNAPIETFSDVFQCMSREGFLFLTKDMECGLEPLCEFMKQTGIESMINVPLFYGDTFTGFIGFDSECKDRLWPEEDIRLLQTAAEIFSAVLSRQASDLKVKQHTWYLESLDRVSKEIVKEQNTDQLLKKLTELILDIFQVDRSWLVFPCDPTAEFFKVPIESTVAEYPGAFVLNMDLPMDEYSANVMTLALENDGPSVIQMPDDDSLPAYIAELSIKTIFMVPLRPSGDNTWVLGVHQCDRHREWNEEELRLFSAIAERVTMVLSNSLLMNRVQDSERYLLEAGHIANLGYWEFDIDTGRAQCSEEVDRIAGKSFIGHDGGAFMKELIVPEDWPMVAHHIRSVTGHGRMFEVEFRIIRPSDNIQRWIYCKAERQVSSQTGRDKLVGIIQDITERKATDERLRLAASVFDNTAEGVIVCDKQGNVLDTNPAFSEILGYEREDVLGKNPRMWQSGRHDEAFFQAMWQSIEESGQWRGEIWNRRKDGSIFPEWLNISGVYDVDGELTHYIAVFTDISQIKQSQEKLDHLAHHDPLTGLPNRLLLNARLEQAIHRANRKKSQLVVIFLDLDRFKHVNDSLGHMVGDKLLLEAAERLNCAVREDDTVARIGGDEFVLLLEDTHSTHDVTIIAEKIIKSFKRPFELNDNQVSVTASLGICLYPDDGEDSHTLLRNADAAMYQAKEEGRDDYHFYTQELTKNVFERVLLENNLRQAINNNEFYLTYQPQVDLSTQKVIGLEALIRWQHPQLGVISPAKFIPVAEDAGLIHPIGSWVLLTACQQAMQWLEDGLDFGRIAINIAGPQIQRGELAKEVQDVMDKTGLDAKYIELEVTETFIMQRADYAIAELHELRNMGITLAIDDFGTGYSSLSYLKALPIHKLKIDQGFVRDIPDDTDDMAIAQAVIALGHSLGLTVIAEGIETKEQAEFLFSSGCEEGQGYLYSRPVPVAELEVLLADSAILGE